MPWRPIFNFNNRDEIFYLTFSVANMAGNETPRELQQMINVFLVISEA